MRAVITQTDFYTLLQTVSRSSGNRSTLPVLSSVMIQAAKDRLSLSCTNLEIGVLKSAPATVSEEGSVTIPVKNLLEVVSALPATDIELEGGDDGMSLSTPNFKANFNGLSPDEFPSIPLASVNPSQIPSAILLDTLPQITFSAAVDEGRPILTGILTKLSKDKLELVATDGFRLAHKIIPLKSEVELSSLIPRKTFEEVSRLLSEQKQDEILQLAPSENQNQIVFTLGDTSLSSRLIEGNFPAWEKIVPQEFVTNLKIDKPSLHNAIKLASVFAKDNANIIKIEISDNSLTVLSEAKELGSGATSLDASVSGEALTIAYNARFLTDVLSQIPGDEINLFFSGALSPTLIKPVVEENLEYVVMPIRLS